VEQKGIWDQIVQMKVKLYGAKNKTDIMVTFSSKNKEDSIFE
jgi:hypothetical protein